MLSTGLIMLENPHSPTCCAAKACLLSVILYFFPENYLPNKKKGLPLPSQIVKGKNKEKFIAYVSENKNQAEVLRS